MLNNQKANFLEYIVHTRDRIIFIDCFDNSFIPATVNKFGWIATCLVLVYLRSVWNSGYVAWILTYLDDGLST